MFHRLNSGIPLIRFLVGLFEDIKTVRYYFKLQQRRLARTLSEIGINPILGYVLAALAFISFSVYLFYKTAWAEYIYAVVALSFVLKFSAAERNDFLKLSFSRKHYYQLRLVENSLVALPFCGYLLYEEHYLIALILWIILASMVKIDFKNKLNITIPTPFYKYPFEFIVGFRKSLLFILLAYFLAFKAWEADNFNLGVFSLGLLFLIGMSFYTKPENEYFVWMYAKNTTGFLIGKITTALICASFLTVPILLALAIWKTDQIGILISIQSLGYIFLAATILAKYSAYPLEMNLPQAIFLALSLSFPPMLLVVLPLFYIQSKKRLNSILG